MKINRYYLALGLIFCFVLGFRLSYSLLTPNFSDSTSYYNLRQIESIKTTGLPIFNDELSYSGRFLIFLPFFQYSLAILGFFSPIWIVGKLLPAIFASSLVLIAYLVAFELTKSKESALVTSLIAGFIPIYIEQTLNTVSVYTMAIPMTLLVMYLFMRVMDDRAYVAPFLIGMLFLAVAHLSVFVLILSFLFYLVLVKLEKLKYSKAETELILFSSFFITWLSFVVFKRTFLLYGPTLIWQNIPSTLIAEYFKDFNVLEAIYKIGILPFVFGFYIIYKTIFVEKNRKIYLFISFCLTILLLVWLRLVALDIGLIFLSVVLTILFAPTYKVLIDYIGKTRFSKRKNLFIALFLLVFFLTSFLPSVDYANQSIKNAFAQEEIEAMEWIQVNTPEESVVLATLEEGHLVNAIAKRKNVVDNNFLMQPQADQRLNDVNTIYSTKFETEAIRLLNKYEVDYIVFSDIAKTSYDIDQLSYVNDENCFELVYENSINIYQSLCVIEEER